MDDVEGCLRSLAVVDPLRAAEPALGPGPHVRLGCVHNDAHLQNVFWSAGQVVALLDFEWVRLGPPDLELEPHLRTFPDADPMEEAKTREILGWLAETHPAAFGPPDLILRLWLYQIAFALRQLVIWAPDRPAADLPVGHPLRRLRQLVEGPRHLHRVLPDAHR
jgi:aminoglycoside phosphotransferase (APT) family kinase protein